MKQLPRRLIFILFVCSFFSTASFITFYTLGYRYNTERGIFIYTGSITVQSNPAIVNISVDNEPSKANINQLNGSYHLAGLQPGEHFIEVSADGYTTWSKKFIVNSGISTEFWNVMLTKTAYAETTYPTEPINKVFPSPTSTLLAYVSTTDGGFSVNTFDTEANETVSIFDTQDYAFDRDDKENIEWSIDSDYVSIPVTKNDQKNYFIVNNDTKEVINLHDIAQIEDIHGVRWDSSRNKFVLALSGKTLYEVNIDSPEDKKVLAENVQSYDISGNDIYIFEPAPSHIVYKTSINNLETRIPVTTLPEFYADDDRYSIIAYDQNRLILINYFTGKLFGYNKNDASIRTFSVDADAKGAQFSDDGKKVLYWTDREMFVYFNRDWETQPVRLADTSITLGRFSQGINNIHWAKDYEHATFSVGNSVKLIELDNRGEKSIMDVITLPYPPLQILSNFDQNMLFYTLTEGSLQNQGLRSINFPEEVAGLFTPNRQ
ncbi:MAG: carboxypeptidase-like regulatory domain-containing protein [Candidatus Moranbacteria bacterium]|nr:carboxypeptidase-like regulatory domain-containing protein [Candidatus Moranbacteria bacterium]